MEYHSGTSEETLRNMELKEMVIESCNFFKRQSHILTAIQDSSGNPNAGVIFVQRHHTLVAISGPLLGLIYLCFYYLHLASTILVVGTPFQTKSEGSPWTHKSLFMASLDRAWCMLLNDTLFLIILVMAIFLYFLIMSLVLNSIRVDNVILRADMMELETLLFVVWLVHFFLTVSLLRPVTAFERLWGMAAIKRSGALLRGRKWTAIKVNIFLMVGAIVENLLQTVFIMGPKWVMHVGFLLSLGSVVLIYLLVTTMSTVFYFSCLSTFNDQGLDLPSFQSIPFMRSEDALLQPDVI